MTKLNINGQQHEVDLPTDTPLLYVLRDHIGLTGTKFGCGAALCGACTVHLDGVAARSCVTPIGGVAGVKITTIEGLDAKGQHPVQRAWIKEQVPACGYCQSGQIMSAVALLHSNPKPSVDEARVAMSGNLCRCGAYDHYLKAVMRAAGEA